MSAQANCVGLSTLPLYDSLTPRWAAGPGAHSVGQGLTVTAEPTPERHSPNVSPVYRDGVGCPQFGSVDMRRPPLRVVLLLPQIRRAAPTGNSVGRGLTASVTAVPTSDQHSPIVSYHWSPGAGRPLLVCRPRAYCDGCAYPGPWLTPFSPGCGAGRPQPRANCDGCAYPQSHSAGVTHRPGWSTGAGRPQCRQSESPSGQMSVESP